MLIARSSDTVVFIMPKTYDLALEPPCVERSFSYRLMLIAWSSDTVVFIMVKTYDLALEPPCVERSFSCEA
ncbi:hypothetical protein M8J75_004548 [Diaphorina citri]|nr:hypothetical protein M8J75_004548 [Diaphorina citri]